MNLFKIKQKAHVLSPIPLNCQHGIQTCQTCSASWEWWRTKCGIERKPLNEQAKTCPAIPSGGG